MTGGTIVFVATLVQDLAVLRPLVRHAAGRPRRLLVARRLAEDRRARPLLAHFAPSVPRTVFARTGEAIAALSDAVGLVVFASESRSPFHRVSHALAHALPSRFVSATLQHGYECIGFLHNFAHDRARQDAGFAADLVCGWFPRPRLADLPPRDSKKLVVTGATSYLEPAAARWLTAIYAGNAQAPPRRTAAPLLVCENLQSVRIAPAAREAFLDALTHAARRTPVVLRPHPAGPFVRGDLPLPKGVRLDARPLEDAGLDGYRAAISPPSSIVLDLIRHDTPVAVWRDPGGSVDDAHYGSLPRVGDGRDWLRFLRSAEEPVHLAHQRAFVRSLGFPVDTAARFDRLLAMADDVAA